MKLKLEIQMDNAAFADDGNGGRDEAARLLEVAAQKLRQSTDDVVWIYDLNGNRVGKGGAMNNPNCDGIGPCTVSPEVRVLPTAATADASNAILCQACYLREISWRRERNKSLARSNAFPIVLWKSLEIYGQSRSS